MVSELSWIIGRSPRFGTRRITLVKIVIIILNLIVTYERTSLIVTPINVAKLFLTCCGNFAAMEDTWARSDCLTIKGFPPLLWETLQHLGVTERPLYYCREYEEDGKPKCEIHLHIVEYPLSDSYRVRCIPAIGTESSDTCQIAAERLS